MPATSIKRANVSLRFKRTFSKLPVKVQERVVIKITLFEENPRHPSLRVHKLKGKLSPYRSFSVGKRYRVVFKFVNGDEVLYLDVGTHKVYQ